MGNMSYVRFENTLRDLEDCCDHMHDSLSKSEESCRKRLIKLCCEIAEDYGDIADGDV